MFTTGVTLLSPSGGAAPASTTWNPLDKIAAAVLSNGNLTVTGGIGSTRAIASSSSGKFYYEAVVGGFADTNTGHCIGISNAAMLVTSQMVQSNTSCIGVTVGGAVRSAGVSKGNAFSQASIGGIISVAVDITNSKFYVRVNGGAWGNSGNPVAGTGGYTFVPSGAIYPTAGTTTTTAARSWTARFSAASWGYTAPTGYLEWA